MGLAAGAATSARGRKVGGSSSRRARNRAKPPCFSRLGISSGRVIGLASAAAKARRPAPDNFGKANDFRSYSGIVILPSEF